MYIAYPKIIIECKKHAVSIKPHVKYKPHVKARYLQ